MRLQTVSAFVQSFDGVRFFLFLKERVFWKAESRLRSMFCKLHILSVACYIFGFIQD